MIMRLRRFKDGLRECFFEFANFRRGLLGTFRLFRQANCASRGIAGVGLGRFYAISLTHVNRDRNDDRFTLVHRTDLIRERITVERYNVTRTRAGEVGQFVICICVITTRFLRPYAINGETTHILIIMRREGLSRTLQRDHDRLPAQVRVAGRCVASNGAYLATHGPCVRGNQRIYLLPIRCRQAANGRCRCR